MLTLRVSACSSPRSWLRSTRRSRSRSPCSCELRVYAALILSFATGGRLTSSVDVVIVQTFFFALFVLQFAVMLFLPDERNLLLVWPDANVAEALTRIQFGVLAIAALAVAVVTVHSAGARPRGRAGAPCCRASAAACPAVLYAANLITLIAGRRRRCSCRC